MSPADRTCWETPPELFGRLDRVFRFDLDPCALPTTAKCARFFTPEQDGLAQPWATEDGTPAVCWLNPPYGRGIAAWLAKARAEAEKGATVVALLPDDQSTRWFHDHVHRIADIWPLDGRVRFVGAAGSPNFGSIIAVYWPAGFWRGNTRKEAQ
jgi:phage N-6-adenine-methyltransferase